MKKFFDNHPNYKFKEKNSAAYGEALLAAIVHFNSNNLGFVSKQNIFLLIKSYDIILRVTPNYFIIMFVEFSHMEKKDFPRVILSNILEAFHLQGLCLMLGISALLITRPGRCEGGKRGQSFN